MGILMESSSLSRTSYSLRRGSIHADNHVPTALFQCQCCIFGPGHLWLPQREHCSPTSPITWLFSWQGFLQRVPQWLSQDLISQIHHATTYFTESPSPNLSPPPHCYMAMLRQLQARSQALRQPTWPNPPVSSLSLSVTCLQMFTLLSMISWVSIFIILFPTGTST